MFSKEFAESIKLVTNTYKKMVFYKEKTGEIFLKTPEEFKTEVKSVKADGGVLPYSDDFVNYILYSLVDSKDEIIYYNDDEKIYCFNLNVIRDMLKETKNKNPYTGKPFSQKFISDIVRLYVQQKPKPVIPPPPPKIKVSDDPSIGAQMIINSINDLEIRAFYMFTSEQAKRYYQDFYKQREYSSLEQVLDKHITVWNLIDQKREDSSPPPISTSPIINPNYGQISPEYIPPPSPEYIPPPSPEFSPPPSPEYAPKEFCINFELVPAGMKIQCEDWWQHNQYLDFVKGVNEKDIKRIAILLTPYIRGNPYQIKGEMMLKDELARKKSEIDYFIDGDKGREKYYGQITTLLDPFARFRRDVQKTLRHGKKSYITNAFLKCWEMIYTFNLIPSEHSSDYTVFGNAEFPGAFIFAINKYITEITRNPRYKWYANSLFPDKKEGVVLGDEFKLYENYPDNWLMDGKENDGDVTKLKTVDAIRKKLGGKVDLYTSDIGIGLDITNFNKQEELEAVLNLGQVLCALSTLKIGGSMVCKMFMFFTPFNISLLSMLNNLFDEFYLSKPVTSRPGNSEIYIVGKGYKGYNEGAIQILRNALSNWDENSVNIPIAEIKEEFYSKILNSAYQIYKRQIRFVGMNIEISKRCYEKGIEPRYENLIKMDDQIVKDELRLREQMKDEWILDYHGELLYNPTKNDLVKK